MLPAVHAQFTRLFVLLLTVAVSCITPEDETVVVGAVTLIATVVATAELTWHDPKSGQLRRVAQTIRRGQFSESFSQAPAWFQQGVIAAKTAEVLRGSYFAPSGTPWAQVFALTQQLDPAVAERTDFGLLLDLIKNADRLH